MRILLSVILLLTGALGARAADANPKQEPYSRSVIAAASADISGLFVGAGLSYQITDITIHDFSGISADGFTASGHVGYNFCGGVVCVGPEIEYGVSDAAVELGQLGDVLKLDDFVNVVATVKGRVTPLSWVGARVGYEWQWWSAFDAVDIESGWYLLGAEVGTQVSQGFQLKLTGDILFLDAVEVDGVNGAQNDRINGALDETMALRVQLRGAYSFGGAAAALESLRF